jgi:hypothetical protein
MAQQKGTFSVWQESQKKQASGIYRVRQILPLPSTTIITLMFALTNNDTTILAFPSIVMARPQ